MLFCIILKLIHCARCAYRRDRCEKFFHATFAEVFTQRSQRILIKTKFDAEEKVIFALGLYILSGFFDSRCVRCVYLCGRCEKISMAFLLK